MAGIVPLGELKPGLECAIAGPANEAAIRELLRENPMGGAIELTFEREPNYDRGANLAGGSDRTIVVSDHGRLVCVGRCTRRRCWVNGEPRTAGYLGELRLDQSVRGHGRYLRRGYEFFRSIEAADPCDVYFTAVASDNLRARRVLEAGMRGLPRYKFLDELTTLLVPIPRRSSATSSPVEPASDAQIPELVGFLNEHGRRAQFAPAWTDKILRDAGADGLPAGRLHVARRGSAIVACGGLWDQRAYRQTVIRRYSRALALTRPLINATAFLFGGPRLPSLGAVLPHAFVSPLAWSAGNDAALASVVESFFPVAATEGLQYLTLALPSNHPRLSSLQRHYRARVWSSRLYQVSWPDLPTQSLDRSLPFLPEIAFL